MSSEVTAEQHLARLPYFQGQPAEVIASLASRTRLVTAQPGQVLFLEGEPSDGLWIVATGRVKVYKLNTQGQEHILRIFGDADTFNDVTVLDGGPNPANAAALSETRLWVLPADAFRDLLLKDNAFAVRVVQMLSGRVRSLVRQIEDLTLYSVIVRLARLLLNQADDPALSGTGVTRAALALHLATTPQTISTALRELEVAGAIEFDRHQIRIVHEDLLRSIAML
ncbi:MAG: Crp/Fnr family transcriptional regulator [Pleurocapsa minor GSE-CHR-MK-17-07R]|jgi:CRP/FNR family transcriptional regulator|nr:Crp/Fnr family transcriptional regulator [Pleurocapsa minor GSE-CHR-MK 17-07R]